MPINKRITSINFLYESFNEDEERTLEYLKNEAITDVEVNNQYYKLDSFIFNYKNLIEELKNSLQFHN